MAETEPWNIRLLQAKVLMEDGASNPFNEQDEGDAMDWSSCAVGELLAKQYPRAHAAVVHAWESVWANTDIGDKSVDDLLTELNDLADSPADAVCIAGCAFAWSVISADVDGAEYAYKRVHSLVPKLIAAMAP